MTNNILYQLITLKVLLLLFAFVKSNEIPKYELTVDEANLIIGETVNLKITSSK